MGNEILDLDTYIAQGLERQISPDNEHHERDAQRVERNLHE